MDPLGGPAPAMGSCCGRVLFRRRPLSWIGEPPLERAGADRRARTQGSKSSGGLLSRLFDESERRPERRLYI